MLAITLTIIVIAQNPDVDRCQPGLCGGEAMISAFRQAAQRVLGSETQLRTRVVASDPPDEVAVATASDADGVVELSFSPEGQKAHLHCYVAREKRWLDREISFGDSPGTAHNEINERGRLLGFAVATMYASEANDQTREQAAPAPPPARAPSSEAAPKIGAPGNTSLQPVAAAPERRTRRVAEFAAIMSTGLEGTAAGLGASAGFRLRLTGPIWTRLFIAGRTGNVPEAQASTRTALMGGGLAFAFLPDTASFELGTRLDLFACYFDASHLSEDDVAADRRSRWQAGADVVAEGGWHVTRDAGAFLGLGVEGVLGKTEIYTHHQRVAVVSPFRATAELGFRTRF
ncbi:MAG TPA: hypothetical protein VER11_20815 [Polyangiaceae bacterium]|nr:hypothetical protein [Polyangiaceae bacterium]